MPSEIDPPAAQTLLSSGPKAAATHLPEPTAASPPLGILRGSLLEELTEISAGDCFVPDGGPAQSDSSAERKRKGPGSCPKPQYFEFAKQRWEKDEAFQLADGSFWPIVQVHSP